MLCGEGDEHYQGYAKSDDYFAFVETIHFSQVIKTPDALESLRSKVSVFVFTPMWGINIWVHLSSNAAVRFNALKTEKSASPSGLTLSLHNV